MQARDRQQSIHRILVMPVCFCQSTSAPWDLLNSRNTRSRRYVLGRTAAEGRVGNSYVQAQQSDKLLYFLGSGQTELDLYTTVHRTTFYCFSRVLVHSAISIQDVQAYMVVHACVQVTWHHEPV